MSLPRCLLCCIASFALFAGVFGAPVFAQPADKRVEQGLSEFQDLEFAAAIRTLEELLNEPDLSQSQTLIALELVGISHLSLGNTSASRRAFERLLRIEPEYVLRYHDGSPKVESLFESVRESVAKPKPQEPAKVDATELALGRVKPAQAGRRWELVLVSRGGEAKEILVWWRVGTTGAFQRAALRQKKSDWRAKVRLPEQAEDSELHYYVVAKGVAGQTLATLGSAAEPLRLAIRGKTQDGGDAKKTAWYGRWPVWAGVGAVVVGGSIWALSSGSDSQKGALSPGRITLSP